MVADSTKPLKGLLIELVEEAIRRRERLEDKSDVDAYLEALEL